MSQPLSDEQLQDLRDRVTSIPFLSLAVWEIDRLKEENARLTTVFRWRIRRATDENAIIVYKNGIRQCL